jgi:serine/threonine protein kinase/Tol biopolymer transport system component
LQTKDFPLRDPERVCKNAVTPFGLPAGSHCIQAKLGHPMKICPHCTTGFHDSLTTCPTHGGLLSEIRDLKPGMLIRDTYLIKKKLGKGGMGSVYLATHTLLDEPRALKFLSQDLSEDEGFTGRFLREVRTLRSLRNRNVVDCGDPERAEDGSLFFSMEFVDGPTLRDFMKTAPKPFDVILALGIMRGIADGLGAAHSKGVVHRDIKPENILMARDGALWIPKIVDFGIVATKESGNQTRTGSMLLTMAYAAPEQWMGTRAAELDGRTDLYALGGVFFEMLTGRTAFDAESYHEWAQKHMNAAPPAPSSLRPDLAQWKGLDALVQRMLAKDINERPRDVAELLMLLSAITYDASAAPPRATTEAATIFYEPPKTPTQRPGTGQSTSQRFGTGQPFTTPPPAAAPPLIAAAPPLASVPPPAAPQSTYAATSVPPPQNTGGSGIDAASVTSGRIERTSGPVSTIRTSTQRTTTAGQTSGAYPTMTRPSRTTQVRTTQARTTAGASAAAAAAEEPRAKGSKMWIWVVVLLLLGGGAYAGMRFYQPKAKVVTLSAQTQPIVSVAFSADGQTLVTASKDNTIQIWKTSTDKALNTFADHVNAIALSSDDHTLAAADWDKNVQLWSIGGQILDTMDGHTGPVLAVAFSPDGHVLASGSSDKTVRLWTVATGKTTHVLTGHTADVRSVAFSSDGRTVASGSADNTINLWDAWSGALLRTLKGHTGPVNAMVFSPDGHTLASASDDKTIILWDPSTGATQRTLHGHTDAVRSVAFSPDGRTLASGSDDTTVKLWNATSGAVLTTLQGHSAAVTSVAFNPDGTVLASGSADNTTRLWDLTTVHY